MSEVFEVKVKDNGHDIQVSMYGSTWSGDSVYTSLGMNREQAQSLYDQLGKALHGSGAFLQVAEPTPIIRNPLALSDDALGEPGLYPSAPLADEVPQHGPTLCYACPEPVAVTQADGLGDDSQVPEVVG